MDKGNESDGMPYGHLEQLLKENLEMAKANHRILKRMERNALIGFIAKIVIWLIVLGVPIFFLSSYLAPLVSAVQGNGTTTPSSLFGLPSAEQLKEIVNTYRTQQGK